MRRMGEGDVKARLGRMTERAFEEGAFGLPWFQCENERGEKEGFWGFDHLGQVVKFLDLDGGKDIRALL
jgi:2-hydroxychromene-2-carboxylate isomerase